MAKIATSHRAAIDLIILASIGIAEFIIHAVGQVTVSGYAIVVVNKQLPTVRRPQAAKSRW
jgi:hypothetical protein